MKLTVTARKPGGGDAESRDRAGLSELLVGKDTRVWKGDRAVRPVRPCRGGQFARELPTAPAAARKCGSASKRSTRRDRAAAQAAHRPSSSGAACPRGSTASRERSSSSRSSATRPASRALFKDEGIDPEQVGERAPPGGDGRRQRRAAHLQPAGRQAGVAGPRGPRRPDRPLRVQRRAVDDPAEPAARRVPQGPHRPPLRAPVVASGRHALRRRPLHRAAGGEERGRVAEPVSPTAPTSATPTSRGISSSPASSPRPTRTTW